MKKQHDIWKYTTTVTERHQWPCCLRGTLGLYSVLVKRFWLIVFFNWLDFIPDRITQKT